MAKHAPKFVQLVDDAKTRIRELTIDELQAKRDRGESFQLLDVREESEFAKGHLPDAVHMGKGILERDIEGAVPATDAEIILYCGGGYRSALAADNLQKMGYSNVWSLAGGFRGWKEKDLPVVQD